MPLSAPSRAVILMAMLAFRLCFAQGGSAIITLVMPPPGGEGYSAVQSGAALPEGAASMYYNPANLAELQRATGSQAFFTSSDQNLLPKIGLPGLSQNFRSMALVFPDGETGFDLGIGYSWNNINFGHIPIANKFGEDVDQNLGEESVYSLGAGLRFGMPVSVGLAAKYYDSYLGKTGSSFDPRKQIEAHAFGWAFDLGVLVDPRLSFPEDFHFPAFVFTPSAGYSLRNWGPDVFYVDAAEVDPIPTTVCESYAAKFDFFDAFTLKAAWDSEQERTWRGRGDPVINKGVAYDLLGFTFARAALVDPGGKRMEMHTAYFYAFDFLRWSKILKRLDHGDFYTRSEQLETGFQFKTVNFFGIPFRANPRIEVGWQRIHSYDNGVRNGQKSSFMNFAL